MLLHRGDRDLHLRIGARRAETLEAEHAGGQLSDRTVVQLACDRGAEVAPVVFVNPVRYSGTRHSSPFFACDLPPSLPAWSSRPTSVIKPPTRIRGEGRRIHGPIGPSNAARRSRLS